MSPDGDALAFASNRGNDEGDFDIWVMRLFDKSTPDETGGRGPAMRFARLRRLRGLSGVVARRRPARVLRGARRRGVDVGRRSIAPLTDGGVRGRAGPSAPPVLASRHGGTVAWSPDGQTLAIGEIPEPEPVYNGNPQRDRSEPPALFGLGRAYQLWTVAAPRPVDEGGRARWRRRSRRRRRR